MDVHPEAPHQSPKSAFPNSVVGGIVLAVVMLGAAGALRFGEHAGWLGPDAAARGMQVIIGLALAFYANAIPKSASATWRAERLVDRAKSSVRFAGWAFTLAGLGYAALSAFAPEPFASTWSMGLVALAMTATLGYCLWACSRRTPPAAT